MFVFVAYVLFIKHDSEEKKLNSQCTRGWREMGSYYKHHVIPNITSPPLLHREGRGRFWKTIVRWIWEISCVDNFFRRSMYEGSRLLTPICCLCWQSTWVHLIPHHTASVKGIDIVCLDGFGMCLNVFFFMCLYVWKFLAIISRFWCFFLLCLHVFMFFYNMFVCSAVFQYSRLSAASVLRRLKGEARVTSAGQRQPLLNQPELCQLWELSTFICIIITTNQNFAARDLRIVYVCIPLGEELSFCL